MIYSLPSRGLASALGSPGARPVHRFRGGTRNRLRGYPHSSLRAVDLDYFPVAPKTPPLSTADLVRLAGRNNLGAVSAGQAISMSSPIAGAATTALVSGTSIGSFAGPIGAAVGAIVGLIGSLFAAHSARAAGAKTENDAVNAYLPAFDSGLQAIFQQANAGTLTATDAISAVQALISQWWANMAPYQTGAGRADASHGGNCGNGTLMQGDPCSGTPGSPAPCGKSCTAGCCVGCADLYPTILQAIQVFQNPKGGTVKVCNVAGSSYGATGRAGYSLTYTPPAPTSVAGAANAVSSGLSSVASSLGLGSSSSSSWVLLALLGVGVYLVTR